MTRQITCGGDVLLLPSITRLHVLYLASLGKHERLLPYQVLNYIVVEAS